jgi:hypothetical protein
MNAESIFWASMKGRRMKAFRVPYSYALDVIVGCQGPGPTYTICRMKPGLLPHGVKLQAVHNDPARQGFYIVVEHETFPVYDGTGRIPEVEFLIGEMVVTEVPRNGAATAAEAEQRMLPAQLVRRPPQERDLYIASHSLSNRQRSRRVE